MEGGKIEEMKDVEEGYEFRCSLEVEGDECRWLTAGDLQQTYSCIGYNDTDRKLESAALIDCTIKMHHVRQIE